MRNETGGTLNELHLQRHMQRLEETTAIAKQFPWVRFETDGTCNYEISRARFNVLGSAGYGFWSHRGGPVPHDVDGDGGGYKQTPLGGMFDLAGFDFLSGRELLRDVHLSDVAGWKLPELFVPYREFPSDARRPVLINEFDGGVVDWDSWYRWRKISKASPVAMLMEYPLSVYYILVNCINAAHRRNGKQK